MFVLRRALWRALALAAVLAGPTGALAAAAPYTDWVFDLKRAAEGGDLDKMGELAKKNPDFARIWFYGQVFDLVTPGVPDEVKGRIRPRLAKVAEALKQVEPPDGYPLLILDREATGTLGPLADRTRTKQQQIIDAVRAEDPMAARLAPAEDPEAADPIFYGLFFRADLAGTRLGGDREKAVLLETAQRMAEGFAVGPGDGAPWRTLAAYQGGQGVDLTGQQQVEALLGEALNARLAGNLDAARARLDEAFHISVSARGVNLFAVLLQNGTANAAHWLGQYAEERGLRLRVLQAVRPLGKDFLTALALDETINAYLGDHTLGDLPAYTRDQRQLGAAALGVGRYLRTLAVAATAFGQAGAAEAEAGRLESAMRFREEGEALLTALKAPEAVAVDTLNTERETVRLARERALADSRVAVAAIETRRGRFDGAKEAYEQAKSIYGTTLSDVPAATRVLLSLAHLRLLSGALDEALAVTEEAKPILATGDAVDRARNYAIKGWIRLRRGEYAPAFADANHALETLRDAKAIDGQPALRADLHRLAAIALEAAGYRDDAIRRLEYLQTIDPSLETARLLAQARLEAGRPAEAAEALSAFQGADEASRVAAVYRGCALLAAGKTDDALKALELVPAMTLPDVRAARIVGDTCLAGAWLAKGDVGRAKTVLASSRALVMEYGDPMLAWRVRAVDGEIAAREGRAADAAGLWRSAVDAWGEALGDASIRSVTLDQRTPAWPRDPGVVGRALPDALLKAAEKDKKAADADVQAALAAAMWERRRAAVPELPGLVHAARAPASEAGIRAATARAVALRAVLADGVVEGTDRVAAGKALGEVFADRTKQDRDQRVQSPAWDGWLTPLPSPPAALAPHDGEVRLFYALGEADGHLWVWAAGDASPTPYALPGRAAIAKLIAPAVDAVAEPPAAWTPPQKWHPVVDPNAADWDALADPVATLLPFTKDKKAMARFGAAPFERLVVWTDGPLVRLPFAALVLEKPDRKTPGKAPAFVGAKWAVSLHLLADAPAGARKGEAAKRYAFVGPLPAGSTCGDAGGYQPCAGADAAAEADAVTAAFAQAKDAFSAFGAEKAGPDAVAQALAGHTYVHLGTPVDDATGDVLLAPAAGAHDPGRLSPAGLAALPDAADTLIVTRLTRPDLAAETGDGLRRLAAAAWHAGLGGLVLAVDRDGSPADAQHAGAHAFQVASGADFETALRTWQRERIARTVDPNVGGPAEYHPYFWARWILAPR
jgi:tetratricopeptide (TPR) repeat protein